MSRGNRRPTIQSSDSSGRPIVASGNQKLGAETVEPGEVCVRGETTVHQAHSLVTMAAELERRTGRAL